MNIAYLMLPYHQPLQLLRLVERLDRSNAYFFIHVDKRSKYTAEIIQELSKFPNVKIFSVHKINWAGFTTVEAEIDLMKMAVSSGIEFKYFVLLSGQDYPIKSNDYINSFFEKNHCDFIGFEKFDFLPGHFKEKTDYYHFRDIPYINPRNPKKIPFLVYLYFGLHKRLKRFMPKRKFFKNFEPYFGPQWFVLSNGTVKYILAFIKENKGYLRFMRYTDAPDEFFFHTIIMNSERKANVYDYDRYVEWLKTKKENEHFSQDFSSLRYMDWSDRGKDQPKPAILDISYYETLRSSNDLFARKVDEKKSAELMDKIDTELLHYKK
jgi:hypothetical protein